MKRVGRLVLLLLLPLALPAVPAQAAPAGRITVAFGGEPETFDPHTGTSSPILAIHPNVFDGLLTINPKTGEVVPHLADSYKAMGPTTWEFKLRKGVKFTNGEPVDAAAVKFSLGRIIDPETKSRQIGYFSTIKSIEAVDAHTVRIHTKVPDAVLEKQLTVYGFIVPPKYYSSKPKEYLATHPVGSGPYKLVRWRKHEEIVLEANPDYMIPGVPRIKTAVIKIVPEAATRVAGLMSGDVDFIEAVPPQMAKVLERNPQVEAVNFLQPRSSGVLMVTTKGGPLGDVRVRQALNHAVDVDSIVKNVLKGHGRKVPVFQTEGTFGYTTDVKSYPYDPAKAKSLLAEAGYPGGFEVDLLIPVGRFFLGKEVSEAIGGYLNRVGVRTTVKPMEWGAMVRVIRARHQPEVKPFLYYLARFFFILDGDQAYEGWFHSKSAFGSFKDPEVDKIIAEGRSTVDREKRRAVYHRLNRVIKEKAPMIFLFQEGTINAKKKNIDWEPRINGFPLVRDAALK
jgi:peptide/nickel transport system substrate-binding protein